MENPRRGRAFLFLSASLVVALGGALRFSYLGVDYRHPDEEIAEHVVPHLLQKGDFDTNWVHSGWFSRFDYSPEHDVEIPRSSAPQYNFSSYYLTLASEEAIRAAIPGSAHGADADRYWYRWFSAFMGTAVVLCTLLLGVRSLGPVIGVGVGLWAAVDPQMVQDSHYGRPEMFLALVSLAIIAACDRRVSPPVRAILAGLLFGFGVACKISFVLWIWLPLVACFLDAAEWRQAGWGRRASLVGAAALASAAGFFAGVPRALVDMRGFLAGVASLRLQYSNTMNSCSHVSGGRVYDYVIQYLLETLGWAFALLFVLGVVFAIRDGRWRKILLWLAPAALIVAFCASQRVFFERNFSHGIPLLFLGSGLGLSGVVGSLTERRLRAPLAILVILGAAWLPASISWRLVRQGFSLRYADRQLYEAGVVVGQFGKRLADKVVSYRSYPVPVIRMFRTVDSDPMIILWHDSNDEFTKQSMAQISAAFRATQVGYFPGLFADLRSPSGLKDYIAPTQRVFVVYGPR